MLVSFLFQIFHSFRKFGLGDTDEAVLVVIINDSDDKVLSDIRGRVSGTEIPVEECSSMTDTKQLRKVNYEGRLRNRSALAVNC